MTVLDNFTEEILQSELPKNVLLHNMIRGLDKEKPPQFEVPAKKYTFESNLHGFSYDYQHSTVTISYKVADGVYSDMTVSFVPSGPIWKFGRLCTHAKMVDIF